MSTVQNRPSRRAVRRRKSPVPDFAQVALSGLPDDLRRAVLTYAGAKRAEFAARTALSAVMTRHRVSWYDVDSIAHRLAFSGTDLET